MKAQDLSAADVWICMDVLEFGVLAALVTLLAEVTAGALAIGTIAKRAHLSYDAAHPALLRLEEKGWLRIERRNVAGKGGKAGRDTHLYEILEPAHQLGCAYCAKRFRARAPVRSRRWSKAHYAHVFARDGENCRYCGAIDRPVVDHVIPRCQGGADDHDNLVVACWSCNSRKSGRTPEQAGMDLRPAPARIAGEVILDAR